MTTEFKTEFRSHRYVILDMVQRNRWRCGAELGLASGLMFELLLRNCPELYLIGVDHMVRQERAARVRQIAWEHKDRCRLLEHSTNTAAHMVEDRSCDFVFIDADHRYTAVRDDIAHWQPKVKEGGVLCGHDYNRDAFPGVIKAVDEVFGPRVQVHGWNVWAVRL